MHGGRVIEFARERGVSPDSILDFSANMNPEGLPKEIREALILDLSKITYYPDNKGTSLKQMISQKYNIPMEYIFLGNGATSLIFQIVQAIGRPMRALIPAPTFSEYERAIRANLGSQVIYYDMERDLCFKETYLDALKQGIDIAFLCNPNNPTGILIDIPLLEDILKLCQEKNILLCIDECFLDFVKNGDRYSQITEIEKYYNIIILKSLTKKFVIPGLRLGYLITRNQEILQRLMEVSPTWNINSLALVAGEIGLGLVEKDFRTDLAKEREFLIRELSHLGFMVYPSKTNFILFYIPSHKEAYSKKESNTLHNNDSLYFYLLKKNILIRSCEDYRGLDTHYYRIAVKKHRENKKLLEAIKEYGKKYYDSGNDV